ncbi:hypothetical protein CEUSTIGMA_g7277.t1 [Chlamydomonas eustigma]|uniref:BOD1/SHG1 domain-containing protein n=1 Tax=Chlamydomonas eustigma TaxID=1157962 RepID=A0A250X9U5_9CHLO|nr:hypothetical protein CEUSTIGMA_g7277.t1 [Chlamydomonas eustigma]|eukprot:GAX79837.1 hypothetical protein CEUSTIGMA_g7277.t1 [Chlamydomonas eustigma]
MALPDEGKLALEWIMNEGHFDEIRKKVVENMRQNENLKQFTMQLLDESKTLTHHELTESNRKKILDELRKELEDKILDKACSTAFGLMGDPNNELCRLINEKVHEALCVVHENQARRGGPA